MRDSTIEDSTFTGGLSQLGILKFYASNATPVSNVGIRRNQFSGFTANALDIEMIGMGLGTPGITIEGNTITKNVGISTVPAAAFLRLHPTQPNGQVDFVDNTITATGTFGAATAVHGIQLRGNGPVSLTGNVIDGGGVGGSGTTPASSGVFIESRAGSTIMPATTVISGSCNRIQDFHNGVSVFSTFAGTYGGLPAGASVSFDEQRDRRQRRGRCHQRRDPDARLREQLVGLRRRPRQSRAVTRSSAGSTPLRTRPPSRPASPAR